MHINMHIRTGAAAYILMSHTRICILMYILKCIYIYTYYCTCIYNYLCVCMHTYRCGCWCACSGYECTFMHTSTYLSMYIYTHMYINAYSYMDIYLRVHTYTYFYVHAYIHTGAAAGVRAADGCALHSYAVAKKECAGTRRYVYWLCVLRYVY